METITIPSPSAFLSSPVLKPAPEPPPPPKKRKQSTSKPSAAQSSKKEHSINKPKQSKSRNGSIALEKAPDNPTAASPVASDGTASTPGGEDTQMQDSFFNAAVPSPSTFDVSTSLPELHSGFSPMFDMSTPNFSQDDSQRSRIEPDSVTSSLSSMFEDTGLVTPTRSNFSGQSPRLADLLQSGSDLNTRPSSMSMASSIPMTSAMMGMPMSSPNMTQFQMTNDPSLEGDIEEIIREPSLSDADMWLTMSPFQPQSRSPSVSPRSFSPMYRQPDVPAGSPEMLMLRFDKQTCGILSVKDGPTENPWRTLVWPLARDSPALYHAIASMTAFHTSKEKPALRVDGMEHMRRSIRSLATGIEKMRTDTALATTLVLAFAESWDQHISTGIEHLRGAKILVNQALIKHNKRSLVGDDLARLKFLCNTWVYMDVIARLTSIDDEDSTDFENILSPLNNLSANSFSSASSSSANVTPMSEIDPLMGSAATLFPLIGRAANLCRKQEIEQWQPSTAFSTPEDPTSEIQHALQTAEAYRYATLLHLHQAVPEIPSLTCAELAKKVLVFLATVPLSSRLVIVQIYPLLAAGCEAKDAEDRAWVNERWASMGRRMWIGNIDRCWEVMQEVWRRRDEVARKKEQELMRKNGGRMGMSGMHGGPSDNMRRFEEGMENGIGNEEISFSDLLNLNEMGIRGQGRRASPVGNRQRHSISGPSQGSFGELMAQRQAAGLITEEMDQELTVRGKLHWVGVMKDWEWEILLG
ncbi:uncharacterized protein EAF02_006464 [Botrytis sinoallii]|uniref:uncharacterized protein n=1 Tax=Botrytis sinoallii TaxID=1463999 RepID=UPI0019026271|nr:uncharacterized protein EAF02_006464 [Botrytis sinoallii]KAF7881776.1 hypothetical protein EAF02_006464 [Botrytis sinoallii]